MEQQAKPNKSLPFSFAKRNGVVLTELNVDHATVVHLINVSSAVIIELQRYLGVPLKLEEVDQHVFQNLLTKVYEQSASSEMALDAISEQDDLSEAMHGLAKAEDLLDSADDAPIIRLLNSLLSEAIKLNASDIHIETFEDKLLVRFRVDGVLRSILTLERKLAPLMVSRIKVMAKLDIAEKRLPQDGRIALLVAGHPVDVRVSTMPSSHAERVVLRLLDKKAGRLELDVLGFPSEIHEKFRKLINQPNGIILVTGPTGSGKTTTLYAAITELNQESRNILTVEDPIEYYLAGIGQTQVNTKVDMTFARGLRAILRQDPDIVMVGEIRDIETAQIAVQASLTGHLVLSTLHTNDAIGAITRMRDMGVESFLLSSTVLCVIAQRLVRTLCPDCKIERPANEKECDVLHLDPLAPPTIYRAGHCEECNETGYKGRRGIYELVTIDEQLQSMIQSNESELKMKQYAYSKSDSLREAGKKMVLQGITSIEELIRVSKEF